WADERDGRAGPTKQQVSSGAAPVALLLNGLGFSNRRLDLVSQFFATQPVEYLLGAGITAAMLHDDCLGRTLDWLHDHAPTALFAGIARQARQRFGIGARQVHVDTPAFAVTGEYDAELDAHTLAVTYGYSRDHRADLKGVAAEATAFAHRERRIMVTVAALYARSDGAATQEAWVMQFAATLRQGDGGALGAYVNFLGDEGEARVREAYPLGDLGSAGGDQGLLRSDQALPPQPQRPPASGDFGR